MKLHLTLQSLVTRHSSLVTALAFALVSAPAGAETVQIASAADWATFANRVNAGEMTLDAAMTADVVLSQASPRIGDTEEHAWKGTFDGAGHTLSVHWSFADGTESVAPFAHVSGCTIQNLHVAGTIQSNGKHVAGFVGTNNGDDNFVWTVITNCRSSVAITCTMQGEAASGGFVGELENSGKSRLEFRDCLFDGSLLGSSANGCGGFVGYRPGVTWLNCYHCLFAPKSVTVSPEDSATFTRGGWDNNEATYRTTTLGSAEGTDASSMTAANLAAALGAAWEASGDKVGLKTFPNLVTIASAEDWAEFANRVNAGETDLDARMIADVVLDAGAPRVGDTKTAPWTGDFDGNGKRLTIAFRTTATGTDRNADLPAAPFAYVGGDAHVHDLHVLGTAETNGRFASGVFGWVVEGAQNTVGISRCRVSVAITCTIAGDATSAGFVAAVQGNAGVVLADCLFDGSLLGETANSCGGFVGFKRDSAGASLAGCLFLPTAVTISTNGCYTLVRPDGSIDARCHYARAFGTTQGTDASAMTADDLVAALGSNWTNANGRVALALFPAPLVPPTPATAGFAYQGALRDAQGFALQNLGHTIAFRIYGQGAGGEPLWGRSHAVTLDESGLFNAILADDVGDAIDGVASNGLASVLASNAGTTLYVGLTVDGDEAEISPRQKLLAAPYAVWAYDAASASGDLAAAGKVKAQNVSVSGAMSAASATATDAVSAGTLTIAGLADVSGDLSVAGAISGDGTIPLGGIVAWSGAVTDIPEGWTLCNGTTVNGRKTPDLRNRFVVGAGDEYATGATGGEKTHALTLGEMPSHRHAYKFKGADLDLAWKDHNYFYNMSDRYSGNGNTKYTDYAGGGRPHENRPPYYALCYIMRVR